MVEYGAICVSVCSQASAAGVTAATELVRFVIFDIHPLRLSASFKIDKQVCVCVCVCVCVHVCVCACVRVCTYCTYTFMFNFASLLPSRTVCPGVWQ